MGGTRAQAVKSDSTDIAGNRELQPRKRPSAAGYSGNQAALRRLRRHASSPNTPPPTAPDIVHDVLGRQGQPLPAAVRGDMEARFGHDFKDVQIHTDEHAGASAKAVDAHAYTVGRHIVFAPGQFDVASERGQRLLLHELAHVADHAPGAGVPSGDLRISVPGEPAERRAAAASEQSATPIAVPSSSAAVFRQGTDVQLTGLTVNHDQITVPPVAGLSFSATIAPSNATNVTLSIVGDNATIAPGTTINNSSGAIKVDAAQTGGTAHAQADQAATTTIAGGTGKAPFNFVAIPGPISSSTAVHTTLASTYGGNFTHTFTSPGGGQTAIEGARINEQFAGGKGTNLAIKGTIGSYSININDPNDTGAGWELDSSGTMTSIDEVTWDNSIADARPFVANASNKTPKQSLPQDITITQNFRNLNFPNKTYTAGAVTSTTHRRALEDRKNTLKAVTSAGKTEVEDNYAGPTVFRGASAAPASIPAASTPAPGQKATTATTSKITVKTEGQTATPTFSIQAPDLGCTITAAGVLTPGTTAGTVTVRAGDSGNYDETSVTITAPTAPANPTPNPKPGP